ncbi:uncharacterized protein [Chironomus tepperi]|uniref:uncharacterized protein n=1 Tax=Chironomus tepperi TaxID=113505 RepID=UPI00391FAB0F
MRRKLKVDSIFYSKMLRLFTVYLVIFIMRCIGSPVHKCYVCGPESEQPFIDEKFLNASEKIHKTCEGFDQLLDHAKEAYAIECPKGYSGCITKIGLEVTRTCSGVSLNDCRIVNGENVCICNQGMCNGERAKNTDNLHTFTEDDTEDDSDENDQESGDGDIDDFEPSIFTTTTQIVVDTPIVQTANDDENANDETTQKFNEFVKVSVSTMQPSINIAVNFNLSQLVFIYCAIIFAVSYLNSSSIM